MMNAGKAFAIVKNLENASFTDEEKAEAIYLVMNAPTHNSITKVDMLTAIKWLWHKHYYFDEEEINEVDVVEVVRCKDCKKTQYKSDKGCWCIVHRDNRKLNDFCSFGEREVKTE